MKRAMKLWLKGGGLNIRNAEDMRLLEGVIQSHDALVDALVIISATEDRCQKPGCSLDTPMCAAMFARSALALVRDDDDRA